METLIFYLLCWFVLVSCWNGLTHYKKLRNIDKLYWAQLIPLAIAGVSAWQQAEQSKKQKAEAKKALQYRNSAVDTAEQTAKNEASATRYAGQDVDESNVRQGVSDTFNNISRSTRSSGDVLNASSRLSGQQQREYQNIGKGAKIFRQNAMDKYRQTLMQQAGVQDSNRQYSEALKGAAAQNRYNAWSTLGGGVAATNFGGGGGGGSNMTWGSGTPGYNVNSGNYNWGF
jgi:hypothetical protein